MSSKDKRHPVISRSEINHFSGPVPPPAILESYERIVPGIAQKIFEAADRQALHRQGLEKQLIAHNIKKSYFGQCSAFIITMTAIILGFVLIMNGKNAEGISSIITSLVGLSTVSIYGKRKHDKELKQRREEALTSE